MASFINKRARSTSEGDGDLVADVSAGRSSFSTIKDEDLPDNLRAMKPEQRSEEVNKQMSQRKALNEKLSALVAKRDKYVADQRAKAPPKASSFDRVVEDTLKAQIKR
jgi:hypothetical protein